MNFALVIFPGAIARGFMTSEFHGSLNAHRLSEPWRDRVLGV